MAEKVVIGNAELWHGDCREVLPLLPQHDLVLTSGPKNGNRYRRVSDNFLRKLDGAGKESNLRCVRQVQNNS